MTGCYCDDLLPFEELFFRKKLPNRDFFFPSELLSFTSAGFSAFEVEAPSKETILPAVTIVWPSTNVT